MVTIQPSTDQDYEEIVAIGNAIYADRIPDTAEDFRSAIRSQLPEASAQSYVAECDGRVIGTIWLNRLIYVENPNVWYADIKVHPAAQAHGIGSRLYDYLLERLAEHRAQEARGRVREDLPLARRFVHGRGFRETGHGERPSRLEIRSANTDAGRQAAERSEGEGIRIATLDELGVTDELLHRFHALYNQIARDLPDEPDRTDMPFEAWRQLIYEQGERPRRTWLATEGEAIVGYVTLLENHGGSLFAGLTGVARTHRGRGIARALKHYQVEWARRQGVDYFYTENDVANAPMLRINADMGYQALPATFHVVKTPIFAASGSY